MFALAAFLAAFLVFQVQPIVGKAILPWFGGGPAVWTVCLLFFQCVLLAGYAYAHAVATRLAPRTQRRVHIALLAAAIAVMLYDHARVVPPDAWKPEGSETPIASILGVLVRGVGLPYFVLSATAPLVQHWFSRARPGAAPYRLYALSNAGSLLALVSYPFVVEPLVPLHVQATAWVVMFVVLAFALAACARPHGSVASAPLERSPAPAWSVRLAWIAAPACASLLLLATTNQLCQSVAPIPFLWVLPLALYLLSFVLCFERDGIYRREIFGPALAIGLVVSALVIDQGNLPPVRSIAVFGSTLFAACMTLHGELARLRPAPDRLTGFYLSTSIGGALGGVFVAVIAPRVFDGYWELELGLWLAGALALGLTVRDAQSWMSRGRIAPAGVALLAAIATAAYVRGDVPSQWPTIACGVAAVVVGTAKWWWRARWPQSTVAVSALALTVYALALFGDIGDIRGDVLEMRRGFYGVLSVDEFDPGTADARYALYNGQIAHGQQFHDAERHCMATSYYGEASGVGRSVLHHAAREQRALRIGAVGLGTGTIAALGRAQDTVKFYEISPEVVALSRGPGARFDYLACGAHIELALGDARLSLDREPAQQFDVLAIDAFSGDTIPVHLLTREAIAIYLRHLADGGILAIHISNLYLDLEPVVAGHARAFGLAAAMVELDRTTSQWASDWVVLARDPETLRRAGFDAGTRPLGPGERTWTDDATDILHVLR